MALLSLGFRFGVFVSLRNKASGRKMIIFKRENGKAINDKMQLVFAKQ